MTLPGNLVPSLVYLLPTATPPAVSVFTPQTSSSGALSLTTLAVGTHTITARYSGDANYACGYLRSGDGYRQPGGFCHCGHILG